MLIYYLYICVDNQTNIINYKKLNLMKKIILATFCLFLSLQMMAQEEKESKNFKHAIGISGGTGFGIDYSFKLNEYFSFTAKYNIFDYTYEDYVYEIDGEEFSIDATADFKGYDVCVNIAPFKGAFRLIAGYGTYSASNLTIAGTFTESVFIGDVEFTPEDGAGELNIGMTWKEQLPYAGIGFGRAVPNKRVGFGLEIGTYFADSPEVSLQATGIIENTSSQESLLQDAFSDMKYLPYLKFRLSVAIF